MLESHITDCSAMTAQTGETMVILFNLVKENFKDEEVKIHKYQKLTFRLQADFLVGVLSILQISYAIKKWLFQGILGQIVASTRKALTQCKCTKKVFSRKSKKEENLP